MSELGRWRDHGDEADGGDTATDDKPALSALYADDADDLFGSPDAFDDSDDVDDGTDQGFDVDRPRLPAGMPVEYGLDSTVRDGALVRTRLFGGEPTREEAVQGRIADCGVIASLGAVAGHRPEAIRDVLSEREDGSYDVRLHETAFDPDGVCQPTGRRIQMTVTPEVPVRADAPHRAEFAQTHHTGVSWAAILEKAVAGADAAWPADRQDATPQRGYERLNSGSSSHDRAELLTMLTGEPAAALRVDTTPGNDKAVETWLRHRLDNHAPVLVGTLPGGEEGQLSNGLIGAHAYEVVGVNDGKVLLRNPWGYRHPAPMDTRDLLDSIHPLITTLYEKDPQP